MDQKTLADKAGLKYSRLRAIMARENPDKASLDELLALAEVAEIPTDFALNGWDGTAGLAERIDALERQISSGEEDRGDLARQVDELSAALETLIASVEGRFATLATEVLQQVIAQLREQGLPGET